MGFLKVELLKESEVFGPHIVPRTLPRLDPAAGRILGSGYAVNKRLNGKLLRTASRVLAMAIEDGDYELAAILEYAMSGGSTFQASMAELADRVIHLKKHAKKIGDRKMLLILNAAVANSV